MNTSNISTNSSYLTGAIDVIRHSFTAGDAVGNKTKHILPGDSTAELITKIAVTGGAIAILGTIHNAKYIYQGAQYIYSNTKNFIEKTFYGDSPQKESKPSAFKSLCAYVCSSIKYGIYEQTLKPAFTELAQLLLLKPMLEDIKDTAIGTKDLFVGLYSKVLQPLYEKLNHLEYTKKFASRGLLAGGAIGGVSMVVAGCFNPALFSSIPLAIAVGGIGGCLIGITFGLLLDIGTNIPLIKSLLDNIGASLPNNLSEAQKQSSTYATVCSIIGAVAGSFVGLAVPFAGTFIGYALGYAAGALLGFVLGLIEDFIQQSHFDRMTDNQKSFLLSEEDKKEYDALEDKKKNNTLTNEGIERQKELLKSIKSTALKPMDVWGLDSSFATNTMKLGGVVGNILCWALMVTNPVYLMVAKGIGLGAGLALPFAKEAAGTLARTNEDAYTYIAREMMKNKKAARDKKTEDEKNVDLKTIEIDMSTKDMQSSPLQF